MSSRRGRKSKAKQPLSLLLVEGETGEVFYNKIKNEFLRNYRCKIVCLGGLYNINRKIIDKVFRYCQNHQNDLIRVYCCVDRESRYGVTPDFDMDRVESYILNQKLEQILSVDKIIATQDIESWFFYDLEGIYKYLGVKLSKTSLKKYTPPESCNNEDMKKLFDKHGKEYRKGKRAENIISKLDLQKIASNCNELNSGIELIKSKASDKKNELFG